MPNPNINGGTLDLAFFRFVLIVVLERRLMEEDSRDIPRPMIIEVSRRDGDELDGSKMPKFFICIHNILISFLVSQIGQQFLIIALRSGMFVDELAELFNDLFRGDIFQFYARPVIRSVGRTEDCIGFDYIDPKKNSRAS